MVLIMGVGSGIGCVMVVVFVVEGVRVVLFDCDFDVFESIVDLFWGEGSVFFVVVVVDVIVED